MTTEPAKTTGQGGLDSLFFTRGASTPASGEGLDASDNTYSLEKGQAASALPAPLPSHPGSPRNWTKKRKWITVLTASGFGFVSPIASTMLAPALPVMGTDLSISEASARQMILSIFVLAYAFGPLLLSPLSEVYGRVRVMQSASTMFLVFNLACGFASNLPQMLALRFLAGIGASAPQCLGPGIIADCFSQRERGAGLRLYGAAPLVAPAIGSIFGGVVAARTTWRWMFWALSIANAALQICAIFTLHETWEPMVLRTERELCGSSLPKGLSRTSTAARDLARDLVRAVRMLATQPIIMVVAVYTAFLFGLSFLMLSTFAALYTSPRYYGQSMQDASLHYLALGLGYLIGSLATAYLDDWLYQRLKIRYGDGTPELHLPAMVPATILLPLGMLTYGWCAQEGVHWIFADIGACLACMALMSAYYCINRYTVDAYTKYTASAMAATTFLRNLAAFSFPLFAPAMYDVLEYGWGNSLLACLAGLLGVPAPWLFWFYGPAMRAKSRYAAGE